MPPRFVELENELQISKTWEGVYDLLLNCSLSLYDYLSNMTLDEAVTQFGSVINTTTEQAEGAAEFATAFAARVGPPPKTSRWFLVAGLVLCLGRCGVVALHRRSILVKFAHSKKHL